MKLPGTDNPLLLRTDFSDDATWVAVCEAAQTPGEEGFQAYVKCISDPSFDGLSVKQVVALAQKSVGHSFAFIADTLTMTDPERPILVVDLSEEPGRTFRVIPSEMWAVENNLSTANMGYSEFAENTDSDGVFRGSH